MQNCHFKSRQNTYLILIILMMGGLLITYKLTTDKFITDKLITDKLITDMLGLKEESNCTLNLSSKDFLLNQFIQVGLETTGPAWNHRLW